MLSHTHTHTHTHPHPTRTADLAGLTPESQEEGKTRIWPLGAQPWPMAPEELRGGGSPSPGVRTEDPKASVPAPQDPSLIPGRGSGEGGRPVEPGTRAWGPLAPLPTWGRGSYSLETNLSNIKTERLGPFSKLGPSGLIVLQYNECICFLHKF